MFTSQFARRATVTAAAVAATALILTGCGRTESGSPIAVPDAIDDAPATGEVTIWAAENEGKALSALAEEFKKDNPDVIITVTPVSFDELPRKVDTAIASGQVPEILQPSTGLQSFVAAGGIAPVPESLVDYDQFFDVAVDAVTFDDVSYAVPWYVTVQSFFYRADLAKTAGIEAPTTWEESLEFGKALTDGGSANGTWYAATGVSAWQSILPLIYQAGGDVAVDGEFTLDTPEVIDALTQYQAFFTEGISSPEANYPSAGDILGAFANGEVGSFVQGSWAYEYGLDALGGDASKIGVVSLPAGSAGGQGYLGGSGLAVMEDAKNKDAAWKFIRFVSAEAGAQTTYDVAGVLPANRAAWDTGSLAESPNAPIFAAQLEESVPLPKLLTWTEVRDMISTYAEQLARNVITPEEAAAAMQADAEDIGTGE